MKKTMTLRLAEDQARQLEAVARADEMPVSEAVREAIAAHVAARRADRDFQDRLARMIDEDREILARLADA